MDCRRNSKESHPERLLGWGVAAVAEVLRPPHGSSVTGYRVTFPQTLSAARRGAAVRNWPKLNKCPHTFPFISPWRGIRVLTIPSLGTALDWALRGGGRRVPATAEHPHPPEEPTATAGRQQQLRDAAALLPPRALEGRRASRGGAARAAGDGVHWRSTEENGLQRSLADGRRPKGNGGKRRARPAAGRPSGPQLSLAGGRPGAAVAAAGPGSMAGVSQ